MRSQSSDPTKPFFALIHTLARTNRVAIKLSTTVMIIDFFPSEVSAMATRCVLAHALEAKRGAEHRNKPMPKTLDYELTRLLSRCCKVIFTGQMWWVEQRYTDALCIRKSATLIC